MQERYVATADLGTGKIALTVAKVTDDGIEVIYYRETFSNGIRYSCVLNPTKAGAALKKAVETAEKELSIKILQVVVGLPRYNIRQEVADAVMDRDGESCIDSNEIDIIKNLALDSYPLPDPERETIYGAVAQSFSTDDMIQASEDDVVGTPSSHIEGNFKIFVGARRAISNIDIMTKLAGVACGYKLFLPDSTARAVLTESEIDNGVALIEIGAGVTSVSIYQGMILRHFSSIPFGGQSVTNDIKYECGFKESLAESIKLAWGACQPEKLQSMSDKILQINDNGTGTYEHLTIKYLSEIISARMREIIEAVLYQIGESGFARRLRCGIVITGGGAELANLASYVKELTGYNVRIGYPLAKMVNIGDCADAGSPAAATTIGMVMEAARLHNLNCLEEPAAGEACDTELSREDLGGTVFECIDGDAGAVSGDGASENVQEEQVSQPYAKPARKSRPARNSAGAKWIRKMFGEAEEAVGNLFDKTEE